MMRELKKDYRTTDFVPLGVERIENDDGMADCVTLDVEKIDRC